ncbi:anion permease [Trueperella sp. LYQ143]|uniref:anion permease n=1 Tax=unclassified Trueperella TaxID=2630174 RepID=UPI0039834E2A
MSKYIAGSVSGMHWIVGFIILTLFYFYSHYFFASATAHITAMYAAFLGAAIAIGTPPLMAALVLAFISNLFTSLTQYSGGASPGLFGSGYNTVSQWWRVSFIASIASIAVWMGIGSAWMKVIGLW